jgi:hypothetical protein
MSRNPITAEYLRAIGRPLAVDPETELLKLHYDGAYLSRPMLLGADEHARLVADVANLRAALVSLPDRLYGGDFAAFARAVGMTGLQVSAILRGRGAAVTRQARADLYADGTGFRLLELNMGSALGGFDVADLCRGMLSDPGFAEFAAARKLGFVDTFAEQARAMLAECGIPPGRRPVIATTDWPASFATLEPYLRACALRWADLGLDGRPCHLGQLEVRDGRVWLGADPVDVVYRLFMVEDIVDGPALALARPVLDAAARGEVTLFTPMDAEVFGSKGALAMLSDEDNRRLFSAAELASLDRILPWTRMTRPGPVTLESGARVELVEYALAHREDLALKPTLLHGGNGVVLGWSTGEDEWRAAVSAALGGPFVLQRRIRPVPELCPAEGGEPAPWVPVWGAFTFATGDGGVYVRATPVESNRDVVNLGQGAAVGCCFHVMA